MSAPLDRAGVAAENGKLRAALAAVTDTLEYVLQHGIPSKGRSIDDQEQAESWMEDATTHVFNARVLLKGSPL